MNDLDMAAYLDGRLPAETREQIESHLAGCTECRNELVQTRQLLRQNRRPRNLLAAGILAAAAALLVVVWPSIQAPDRPGEPLLRAAPGAESLVAYGPVGESSSSSPTFVWAAEPRATSYRLTLTSSVGAPVWSASTADTVMSPAGSVRLREGERYLWVVDALLDDGSARSTGIREFRVVR